MLELIFICLNYSSSRCAIFSQNSPQIFRVIHDSTGLTSGPGYKIPYVHFVKWWNAVIVYFRMIQLLLLQTLFSFVYFPSEFVCTTEPVKVGWTRVHWTRNHCCWDKQSRVLKPFYEGVLLSITDVTPGNTRNNIIQLLYFIILCLNVNLEVLFSLVL